MPQYHNSVDTKLSALVKTSQNEVRPDPLSLVSRHHCHWRKTHQHRPRMIRQ